MHFHHMPFASKRGTYRRHLTKPRSIKLCSCISRLQELIAYLAEFSPDTEGQETVHLPADEIMDIIYDSMLTTQKNKMIEQGFNYADSTITEMTDFFETRVENLELMKKRKNLQQLQKNPRIKIPPTKGDGKNLNQVSYSPAKILL